MADWQPITTAPHGVHLLLAHKDYKWIRFGRYFPEQRAWYYSGTNERSQYAQTMGDEPTHWMHMPPLP